MSSIIGKKAEGIVGRPALDREQIYRWLYENSDHRGIVVYIQREVARRLEIPYQTICNIYKDFADIGYLKKYQHTNSHRNIVYEVVHDPDDLDWDEDFLQKQRELRIAREYKLNKEK